MRAEQDKCWLEAPKALGYIFKFFTSTAQPELAFANRFDHFDHMLLNKMVGGGC